MSTGVFGCPDEKSGTDHLRCSCYEKSGTDHEESVYTEQLKQTGIDVFVFIFEAPAYIDGFFFACDIQGDLENLAATFKYAAGCEVFIWTDQSIISLDRGIIHDCKFFCLQVIINLLAGIGWQQIAKKTQGLFANLCDRIIGFLVCLFRQDHLILRQLSQCLLD